MQWYVNQNGKTTGPFSEQRVAMLVNWGKIANDAYLCDDQWACWVALARSPFAPLLPNYDPEKARPSRNPPALSEPPAQGKLGHRLALAFLLMLTAAAFLLALWLSPSSVSSAPLGCVDGARPSAPASAADLRVHRGAGRLQPTTHAADRA
jgi:hypothetical protein